MVEGMKTIVATVTGYHGSQRMKLINLITAIGANYVGSLSKSTTHLVCWKYKGEKYELAKRVGTIIVNHRWLEDCRKEGKRLPEHPYTLMSGEDAGFITTDLSVARKQLQPLKENTLLLNKRNILRSPKDVIDLDSDEIGNSDFYDEFLLDEDLFPRPERKTTGRQNSKRKMVKGTSRRDWQAKAHNIVSDSEVEIHANDTFQGELVYLPSSSNKQKRTYSDISMGANFCESSRKSRRLIKKNIKTGTTVLATNNADQQSITLESRNLSLPASRLSNDSNELRENIEESKHKMNCKNDIDLPGNTSRQSSDMPDADERNLHETSSSCQKLGGQHKNMDLADSSAGLRKSAELSCVICWTEYSVTRGVLPCGHRFCFSCIQKWADLMASNRKETTCPLCNASFASITRVDGAASLDQKIYSQTVPCASTSQDIFIVPEARSIHSNTQISLPSVCCNCQSPNPTELLIYCQTCDTSCIHSYCLDPFLVPWTCTSCRDRRLFY